MLLDIILLSFSWTEEVFSRAHLAPIGSVLLFLGFNVLVVVGEYTEPTPHASFELAVIVASKPLLLQQEHFSAAAMLLPLIKLALVEEEASTVWF